MKLYIVRHGETEWNKERRLQGQVDIPLNESGRRLARETSGGLAGIHFDLCYSSPLSRARETAELILEGRSTPVIEDERIIEMAFGECEGGC
ncbi:MAG: histidine phosphatase family protein, partial [Lachnospiraceae bacterium]|nr:histidine phosphatase family protein [Lachnospiraceae bacterium]